MAAAPERDLISLSRFLKTVAAATAVLLLLMATTILALRWVDPPTSAFMIRHWLLAESPAHAEKRLYHEWVAADQIPAEVKLAVIAAEDQRFPTHTGFDLVEMQNALERWRNGGSLRGASTLSQQTAKNLFLWPGSDWLRKGLEAPLTLMIEWLWPKERILEVYLNIAQFGPDTYGVGAASWRFFDRPVFILSTPEAALLAAVLPNPNIYRVDSPSPQVRRKAAWIERQMRNLGGPAYLDRL
ncbi:monofunctional biosynthetic peptidoglycan transglycosylase [Lamprobacter modestohalophilus]|uniref:monofunctional biosynthetic peptidoglycan transglycosylase n=1 Tax=Lamprobacter modestohalophilus TaxID=1064514 RepID=UPI002ADED07B|nr:monofunctional biosynthetic peptidoglycan transglycosylase [Lamprobacter modestohalophilus]MEA1050127.1 monofunctional biosynthetic peptidoglycan transglycosylase [Lamprobacter modestohalophilus]